MVVTVFAAWMVASRRKWKRNWGFWLFILSNILWIAWALHDHAYALIALQLCLAVLNIRGAPTNNKYRFELACDKEPVRGLMASDSELERLYSDVRDAHLQPLWIDTPTYVPRHPAPAVLPGHWPADKVFPSLLQLAGQRVPSDVADRRVLICRNPGLPPFSGTTQTLYACFQLLLPGESAAEHRHTQNALRFVLSGQGAYTTVNGRKVYMNRGDFIVTPAWTWHGHGNETGSEMIWVDGLDSLLIKLFDATFFELPFRRSPC